MSWGRPQEVKELLESLCDIERSFEVVIVEDGSQDTCEDIVDDFNESLDISYYYKENTGPGDSRNFGMNKANGNYFIILDSDVKVPKGYLTTVIESLSKRYLDCYGGGDEALDSFSPIQKAIDYSMTSLFTTGGIRGSKRSKISRSYEPRSFNMGISKEAFIESGGFGRIHPGEDPDLSIRLKQKNFKVGYIHGASVYHKRRTDFKKFALQVHKFGLVRPILLTRYPEIFKLTYWFPFFYILGLFLGLILLLFRINFIIYIYALYNFMILVDSLIDYKNLKIGVLSLISTNIQFFSYGSGFIWSYYKICILKKDPEKTFPKLFFNT